MGKGTTVVFLCLALGAPPWAVSGQTGSDQGSPGRPATPGLARVEADLFELTDRFGPRPAGTRAYRHAAHWVAERLRGAGVDTTYLEAFPDPRPGWTVQRHSLELIEPRYRRLAALPLPWTPSSDGAVTGPVVGVSLDELDRGPLPTGVAGAIVLLGALRRASAPPSGSIAHRLSDEELRRIETNPDPNDVRVGYHGRRTLDQHFESRDQRTARALERVRKLGDAGARAVLVASPGGFGLLRADGAGVLGDFGGVPPDLPVFVVAGEDASLLRRLSETGESPVVELQSRTRTEVVPGAAVSVVGEVRGALFPDEVVLLTAHLDSHAHAPGASDNAASVVSMIEAARRLATGPRPERTVRLALLGAEEHGEFGGAREHARVHAAELVAVLGLDHGPGLIRGIYAMGNPEAGAVLRELSTGLGEGGHVVTLQMSNQSDHEVFDEAGVPSFPFIQDPESYVPWTHHSHLDVPDHVDPGVVARNAVSIEGWARQLARADVHVPHRRYWSREPRLDGAQEFFLPGHIAARAVHLVGSFNSWVMFDIPLARVEDGWRAKIDLPPGRHLYKFIVDGMWIADPATPEDEMVQDGQGHGGLTVRTVRIP